MLSAQPSRLRGTQTAVLAPLRRPVAASADLPAECLPAWPVLVLLWGLPLWWLLGLFSLSTVIVAVPMVLYLLRYRQVTLVPGFLPYLALLVWMVPTALMLDDSALAFVLRFAQFASIGVLAIYVLNARETLTAQRLLVGVCMVWVWVILGGYLGMLLPELRLTMTAGALLPGGLTANPYVAELFFPTTVEVQDPWGADEPFVRPSAPFAYSNGWGASIGLLTPVIFAGVLSWRSRLRYLVLGAGLVIALPPALATTNRGLFLTLGIVAIYVSIRTFLRGHVVPLLVLVGTGLVVVLSGGLSQLSEVLNERQEVVDTTDGREQIYLETWQRSFDSPILGHGSTRPSMTTEMTIGTHGMVWSMMFCFGFVGLALFMWFLGGLVLRTATVPTNAGLWLHGALVSALIMSFFYGLDRHLPYILLIGALVLRDKHEPGSLLWPKR